MWHGTFGNFMLKFTSILEVWSLSCKTKDSFEIEGVMKLLISLINRKNIMLIAEIDKNEPIKVGWVMLSKEIF